VKLIVQIPCHNEADTLAAALEGIPTHIPGITCIETLIIDDGSTDDTTTVARVLGVNHIIRHPMNLGLARTFRTGLDSCLKLGADVIVNTDGDNQYPARYIAGLVAPIVAGQADIVIGDRQVEHISHFSPVKKKLQKFGSWLVRNVSGTDVPDTVSGFRAYSREAALRLNILTHFTYTLETVIQAGKMGLTITSVPVTTNEPTRPSRLQRNTWHFIKAQGGTILRLYAFYEPLRTFTYIALPFLFTGIGLILRFSYYYWIGQSGPGRYGQSLTIGVGLFLVGVFIALSGVQADIAGKHRQLTQEILYRLKKMELNSTNQAQAGAQLPGVPIDEGPQTTDLLNSTSHRSGTDSG
jgi:glycosyltransferase involved in cell wall biosynthesis